MNKNILLLLFTLILPGQVLAMEPMEMIEKTTTTEKKVAIHIQDQQRELPARLIPLVGTIANLYKADTPITITQINLDTWQLIEDQLERAYAISQGNFHAINDIRAAYRQLDTIKLIDLVLALDFLNVLLLKKVTLSVAQEKLSLDEILELPEFLRNEIIKCKAFSVAGPLLVKERAICRHENVKEWLLEAEESDEEYEEVVAEQVEFPGRVNQVAITRSGKVVSGSADSTIRIWDMDGTELVVCWGHHNHVTSIIVCQAQSQEMVASGSCDGTIRFWNMNGQQCGGYNGAMPAINSILFTHNHHMITGSYLGLCIWNMEKMFSLPERHLHIPEKLTTVRIKQNNEVVFGAGDKVCIYNLNDNRMKALISHEDTVTSVCVTHGGTIVSGSKDRTIRIWPIDGEKPIICKGHEDKITSLCLIANGKRMISGSKDGTLRIWDIQGHPIAFLRGHTDEITSVITTPTEIISGSKDGTIRGWGMNGQGIFICKGHEGGVTSIAATSAGLSSGGKIVSGSVDGTVCIWNPMSFVNRLSFMTGEQARAVYTILESAPHSNREEQERCWEEIWRLFDE